jgi:drug/metabolite transporter (DMT)-like permease
MLMILATILLALMDATGKFLATHYPVTQILAARFALFLMLALIQARRKGIRRSLASNAVGLQIGRSLILVAEVTIFLIAFKSLPLATVHSIAAATPLIATALAVPLLGEKVGLQRWVAVIIGCLGVLIIIQPGSNIFGGAAYLAVFGTCLWSLYQILIRKVSADGPETTALYTAGVGFLAFAVTLPFAWKTPDLHDGFLFLGVSLFGGAAHILLIKALQLAPSSLLQPLNYLLVLWGAILGFLIFGNLPDRMTITGAAIVIASGLYTIQRERRAAYSAARPASRSAAPRKD